MKASSFKESKLSADIPSNTSRPLKSSKSLFVLSSIETPGIKTQSCFNLKFTILEMLSASFMDTAPLANNFIVFAWTAFKAFFFCVLVRYTPDHLKRQQPLAPVCSNRWVSGTWCILVGPWRIMRGVRTRLDYPGRSRILLRQVRRLCLQGR
jgi:hypothetical protein